MALIPFFTSSSDPKISSWIHIIYRYIIRKINELGLVRGVTMFICEVSSFQRSIQ